MTHARAGRLLALFWPFARAEPAEGWSALDSGRAELEGWQIFEQDGLYELGPVAHPEHWFKGEVPPAFGREVAGYKGIGPVFPSDGDAWRHVAERAREGGALHRRAQHFLAAHGPEEREAIRSLTGY